ncbi:trypsin-like serine protease [Rubrobacter marinus]|uniref:Trypsin-like serine protease n=1 Tax=Rubrobacter marinus TaxID=2653852 RepID=A0A6G8Q1A6_9ACTN|nr:trypsin-like serine protease [Rubrobacter marinus]QIN80269.1 trypsin-like serine protease [Rubrobacter marinus]
MVGGTAVPDGKYPFTAYVRNDAPGTLNDFACGGTLIDETHVLTAAHCARVPASQLRVTVGTTALSSGQGQVRGASAISIHPRYSSRSDAYGVEGTGFSGSSIQPRVR